MSAGIVKESYASVFDYYKSVFKQNLIFIIILTDTAKALYKNPLKANKTIARDSKIIYVINNGI